VLIKRENIGAEKEEKQKKLLIFSLFLIELQTMKSNTCGGEVSHINFCTR